MKKSKKTPAQIEYDQKRPTVSFRTSGQLKERLEAVKKAEGISNTEIMMRSVGLSEVKLKREEEIRKEAEAKGSSRGFMQAASLYSVAYRCSKCRQTIIVDTVAEKKAIAAMMTDAGWGHTECH